MPHALGSKFAWLVWEAHVTVLFILVRLLTNIIEKKKPAYSRLVCVIA